MLTMLGIVLCSPPPVLRAKLVDRLLLCLENWQGWVRR